MILAIAARRLALLAVLMLTAAVLSPVTASGGRQPGADVTVRTADRADRPLRILGARAADLEFALAASHRTDGVSA